VASLLKHSFCSSLARNRVPTRSRSRGPRGSWGGRREAEEDRGAGRMRSEEELDAVTFSCQEGSFQNTPPRSRGIDTRIVGSFERDTRREYKIGSKRR
jgi:hypothetical protein